MLKGGMANLEFAILFCIFVVETKQAREQTGPALFVPKSWATTSDLEKNKSEVVENSAEIIEIKSYLFFSLAFWGILHAGRKCQK